jgi:predicted phage terminase large subunit-like protein
MTVTAASRNSSRPSSGPIPKAASISTARAIRAWAARPSRQPAGDYSAIVSIARDSATGILYVLDADIKRRKPDQLIEDIFEYHRLRRYINFGIEANQFQQLLCDMLRQRARERGLNVPVRDIKNSADKDGRIQRLQALIGSGKLQFSRRHGMLLDQLRQFPMGAHDDGPDALEMAVRLTGGNGSSTK